MTITPTDVAEYLKSLGTMGDEVAATLKTNGIKGLRMESTSCPIAQALEGRFGMPVSVGPYGITLYNVYEGADVEAETPCYIADFLRAFDRGEYPELDKFAYDESN